MTDKERERDKQLIANLEKETSEQADEIERLAKELEYTRMACERLREDRDEAAQEIERLAALAQSDAEPREIDPTKVICPNCTHQFRATSVADQERLRAQSDAEPVQPQTLRDAAENLLIAIGMGWDIDGCVESLRAAIAQSDAEPQDDGIIHKVKKLEQEIAELTPEQRAVFDTKIKTRSDAAKAAITQSDVEPKQNVLALLREARPYVASAQNDEDNETHNFVDGLLRDIDTALTQPAAKPVAWQYRVKQGGWGGWHDAVPSREEAELCVELGRKASGGHLDDYEIRPLYAAPPRPDASAGLIEAAEWHEQEALRFAASPYTSDKMRGMMHKEDARKLRACAAANRSGE
jgi:hypothetical protein